MGDHVDWMHLSNESSTDLLLSIEPWGDTRSLAPGGRVEIEVRGPIEAPKITVSYYEPGAIALWIEPDCEVRLFRSEDKVEIGAWG